MGTSFIVAVLDIVCTTQNPFFTFPNTTLLPSKCGHGTVVIKNCELFVLALPVLAILITPGSCLNSNKNKSIIKPIIININY